MPYITQREKNILDPAIHLLWQKVNTIGEMNYVITKLLNKWLSLVPIKYRHINEVIGVLECVKQEFYRRLAAYYEDRIKVANGEVYEIDGIPLMTLEVTELVKEYPCQKE